MSKIQKIFSLFIEYPVAENSPSQKKIEGRNKRANNGKTNNKLRSQNYRFASDQNANEALKSATRFNEPIKKLCKLAVEICQEF